MEQEEIPPISRRMMATIPITMRMTFQLLLTKAAVSLTASFARLAALFAVAAVFFAVFSALRTSFA